jgi:hypothetical protein
VNRVDASLRQLRHWSLESKIHLRRADRVTASEELNHQVLFPFGSILTVELHHGHQSGRTQSQSTFVNLLARVREDRTPLLCLCFWFFQKRREEEEERHRDVVFAQLTQNAGSNCRAFPHAGRLTEKDNRNRKKEEDGVRVRKATVG